MAESLDNLPRSGTITALRPLQRDPNLRSLFIDGKRAAVVRGADVETLGLREGEAWTDEMATRLIALAALDAARRAALRLLAFRARSRADLRDRLIEKEHDAAIVDEVLHELESHCWIDDAALARDLIEEITRNAPAGRPLLEKKLRAHKLNDETIVAAIENHERDAGDEPPGDEADDALAFARTSLTKLGSLDAETAARRVAGALMRRGFDEQTVRDAILQLFPDLAYEETM